MKIVYTSENSVIVNNMYNVLQQEGIDVQLKNEFVRSALGEVAAQQAWLEIWVLNIDDFDRAEVIIQNILHQKNDKEWQCKICDEINVASFEICWKCNS